MFDVEKFIGAVEKRPAIYNCKLKEYSNRDIKRKYWDEIGKEMYEKWDRYSAVEKNELGKLMLTKWKSIRDHFKKELRANRASKNGDPATKKKKYIYYDNLLFLIPLLDDNHQATTNFTFANESSDCLDVLDEQVTETIASSSTEFLTNEAACSTPTTSAPSFPFPEPPRRKRMDGKKKASLEEENSEAIQRLTKILSESVAIQKEEMNDESGNKAFLLSLLPFMNKISDEEILSVRIRLIDVVREGLKKSKYDQHSSFTANIQEPLSGSTAISATANDDTSESSICSFLDL
ncbi:uncharacterized protein [Centruroides vittatus]|uniref:uncharacterized protein isoform X2 n=1 Tax=Centruroides vittatus TaxID=120091 RepID=UPI0035100381